jgi:transcription elongation GreA/GreB family factor
MKRITRKLHTINDEPIPMTPEGIERLRVRYEHLKKILPELAAETARTAAYGDRSDNAEYKQAKGALRYTHYEIYRLEDQLKRVVAITPGRNAAGTIRLGSRVTLVSSDKTMQTITFEIVGPTETDPAKGRISDRSPLGAALMNRAEGDKVTLKTTNGERTYQILEVT